MKDKTCCKVRDHCHYTGEYIGNAHSICNLKYRVPKKIPIAFHNASNYDYHVVIKELGEEFEKQLTFLGKNTGKYIKKLQVLARIGKSEEEITKNISYRLQFIDSTRFMSSSWSNFLINLSEEIHKIKCKYGHNDKKSETCIMKHKYCNCFLNTQTLKMV